MTGNSRGKRKSNKASVSMTFMQRIVLTIPSGLFLMLFLELSGVISSPQREFAIVIVSAGLAFVLFMFSQDYFVSALSHLLAVLISLGYEAYLWVTKGLPISEETVFRLGILWFSGLLVSVLIRLFSVHSWDTSARRNTFRLAFHLSSITFLFIYILLLIYLFGLQREIDMGGERSLNLIPLCGAFSVYWPHIQSGEFRQGIFIQFFGNLFIFTPLGFYIGVYAKKLSWFSILLIPIILSGIIEATQYFLNMGKSDIDDFWMNVVGFWIGVILYHLLGAMRSAMTHGKEKNIC